MVKKKKAAKKKVAKKKTAAPRKKASKKKVAKKSKQELPLEKVARLARTRWYCADLIRCQILEE
jgi:hypothetical protein